MTLLKPLNYTTMLIPYKQFFIQSLPNNTPVSKACYSN